MTQDQIRAAAEEIACSASTCYYVRNMESRTHDPIQVRNDYIDIVVEIIERHNANKQRPIAIRCSKCECVSKMDNENQVYEAEWSNITIHEGKLGGKCQSCVKYEAGLSS